jgi:hypothetical protein
MYYIEMRSQHAQYRSFIYDGQRDIWRYVWERNNVAWDLPTEIQLQGRFSDLRSVVYYPQNLSYFLCINFVDMPPLAA